MPSADNIPRRLLALPLGVPTMAGALDALPRLAAEADIIELRLDYFAEPYDLRQLLRNRSIPLLVTNRPPREGGRGTESDAARLAVLRAATELGAEYVDLEWDVATAPVVDELKSTGARVVVSRHSFAEMPSELADWAIRAADLGADVVKVVGMAGDVRDALPVFRVLAGADRPTIAVAMGEAGLPSRVLALRYDSCFLTFAAASVGETAPGQLPISAMRDVYRARCLGPATAAYGLLSPRVETELARSFNDWFAQRDIAAVAVPFPALAQASAIVSAYRELPVAGWHVVGDALQVDALRCVDRLTAKARRIGKVNSIVVGPEGLSGSWVASVEEQLQEWTG